MRKLLMPECMMFSADAESITWQGGLRDKHTTHEYIRADLVLQVVDEIDRWNAAVESIIGRQPNYNWAALERLRSLLKEAIR